MIDFSLPLRAAAAIRVKSVSRQWDPLKGAIGAGKKQSPLKGIRVPALLPVWVHTRWTVVAAPDAVSFPREREPSC